MGPGGFGSFSAISAREIDPQTRPVKNKVFQAVRGPTAKKTKKKKPYLIGFFGPLNWPSERSGELLLAHARNQANPTLPERELNLVSANGQGTKKHLKF